MAVANACSRNTGSDICATLPHRDMWRSAFADGDAADTVFAEVDAHTFAQADAFADSEPHALSFDSALLLTIIWFLGVDVSNSGAIRKCGIHRHHRPTARALVRIAARQSISFEDSSGIARSPYRPYPLLLSRKSTESRT